MTAACLRTQFRTAAAAAFAIVLGVFVQIAAADEPLDTVQLDPAHQSYRLGGRLHYVGIDRGTPDYRSMAADIDGLDWLPAKDEFATIGNARGTYWFAVYIVNDWAGQLEWFARVRHASLESLDIYLLRDGVLQAYAGSETTAAERRATGLPVNVAHFELEPGVRYLLLVRARTDGLLDMPLSLQTPRAMVSTLALEQTGTGLYLGMVLVLLAYSVIVFAVTRDRVYLYYGGFIACFGFFLMAVQGYVFQLMVPSLPLLSNRLLSLVTLLAELFGILYASQFLSLPASRGWLAYCHRAMLALVVVALVPASLLPTSDSFALVALTCLVTFPGLLALAVYRTVQGYVYAYYFVAAWTLFCGFMAVLTLAAVGVIDRPLQSMWPWLEASSALEMLLWSFGLGARLRAFDRDRARVVAESRAKTELLAHVSHELRTPMSGILGMSELLREHLRDNTARHYNDVIYQSGLALTDVINDLLDAARLDVGRLELHQQPFDLRGLATTSLFVIEAKAIDKGIALHCEIDDALAPIVLGDAQRVRQILHNYLGNAIKFTDAGSVTLRVGPDRWHNGRVLFEVIDTGVGISADELPALFQPYSRGSAGTAMDPEIAGTGLGLYICRMLATRMGGEVGADSHRGDGSRFWASLPLPATEEPVAAEKPVAAGSHGVTGRILVVEDNPVNQLVLRQMLENAGHDVEVAVNGEEGVRRYGSAEVPFDAVLMDCEMPVMDGLQAAMAIRGIERRQRRRRTPIIALTAHALDDVKERARLGEIDAMLGKPVSQHMLHETLAQYLKAKPR